MYNLSDTIAVVSSPASEQRVILRISGRGTVEALIQICGLRCSGNKRGVYSGSVAIDSKLRIPAQIYLFSGPNSYTGEDLAEIHIHTSPNTVRVLLGRLLDKACLGGHTENDFLPVVRLAEPGEFTARGYLNGKIDLSQAEAVNEIISSSNRLHLRAAEQVLEGQLGLKTGRIGSSILECLSLIEAGLDFSEEDKEFMCRDEVVGRLLTIKNDLHELASHSFNYEPVFELPSVGIAGAPNSGKSSLINKLLGHKRSIVSEQENTTRDILTGVLELSNGRCVVFDCAGLMASPTSVLDDLAQQAAVETLRKASAVVFCVDISKGNRKTWATDIALCELIKPKILAAAATKCDLVSKDALAERIRLLCNLWGRKVLVTSAKGNYGTGSLGEAINKIIVESTAMRKKGDTPPALVCPETCGFGMALTARHRETVIKAVGSVIESINELKAGHDEIAAMILRWVCESLSLVKQEPLNEKILNSIFKRFCIGK